MNSRVLRAALVLLAALTPCALRAGEWDPYELRLKVGAVYNDNFFEATRTSPQINVWAADYGAELATGFRQPDGRSRFFWVLSQTTYDREGFGSSPFAGGGIEVFGSNRSARVFAHYRAGRPSFYLQDRLDRVDTIGLDTVFSYRTDRALEIKTFFDVSSDDYRVSNFKNTKVFGVGGGVRYRGFGSSFSPDAGVRWGQQAARLDVEEYSQTELLLGARWIPTPRLYTSARYRYRIRDYLTELPDSGNFRRQDNRSQFRGLASLRAASRWSLDAYFAYEDANSLKLTRVFKTTTVGFGVTYHLEGKRRPENPPDEKDP